MSTNINVNDPSASANLSTPFLSLRDRTGAKVRTPDGFGFLIAVGLILFLVRVPCLFVAGSIYLNSLVSPKHLPDLGQFFGGP